MPFAAENTEDTESSEQRAPGKTIGIAPLFLSALCGKILLLSLTIAHGTATVVRLIQFFSAPRLLGGSSLSLCAGEEIETQRRRDRRLIRG